MKMRRNTKPLRLSDKIKRFSFLLIPMLIIYLLISNILINNIRKQTIQNLNEISELYINELDNKFFRISRRILHIIMENGNRNSTIYEYIDCLNLQYDEVKYYYLVDKLKEEFLQFTWEYGGEYHFFLYHDETGTYLNLDIDAPAKDPNQKLQEQLTEIIVQNKNATYSVKKAWDSIEVNNDKFIYKTVNRNGIYLGCYVRIEELLQPFKEIDLGRNGYIQLLDSHGYAIGDTWGQPYPSDTTLAVSKVMKRTPITVQIYISGEREIAVLTGVMFALIAIAVLFLFMYGSFILYFRKQVLKPIQQFTKRLLQYDEGEYVYSLTETNLLELEQADEQFRKMMHQIKKLKITLYEKELEKRNMEIDNLKLQIKPHFYLNCMNFIYSMIDETKYDEARAMSRLTSSYLRGLFNSKKELTTMESELEQCENYLKILELRYGDALEYFIDQDEDTLGVLIFPYCIQIFVENAMKHGFLPDRKNTLSITVYPETYEGEAYVNIYIADNGQGFQNEILSRLRSREEIKLGGESHIGIQNCLKRMELYFGEKGIVKFENSRFGGAIIDIHIPRTWE